MTQEPEFNTSHPEYVPFSNAYIGHVMTGGIVAVTVGIVYWLLSIPFSALKVNLQDFVIFIVLVVIGSELIVTLLQRPLVIKARHGSPGGALYAAYEEIVTPVVAGIGAFLAFQSIAIGGTMFALFLVACLLVAFLTKPWERGLSRAEVRSKYEETKQFIKDDIVEERRKNADVSDEHRKLFER